MPTQAWAWHPAWAVLEGNLVRLGRQLAIFGCVLALVWSHTVAALDIVTLRRDGHERRVEGRIVVTAQDGGLLVLGQDGILWTVPPEQLVATSSNETPFHPLPAKEMGQRVLAGLPSGFNVYTTDHYVIVYNTSLAYAHWCGSLFERLYKAFTNFWSQKGFDLAPPEFPLVAVVFADQRGYAAYGRPEVGDAISAIIGYYSLQSNQMVMYDLTGSQTAGAGSGQRGSPAQINHILAQPDAARLVATIVHEATHQIAFNCGLHARLSDCPLWVSEGIAMKFETPDLSSSKIWKIGNLNESRLARFYSYLPKRPADSLRTLISDDKRLRDTAKGLDAYAEAWALTYFLMKNHPRQYVEYLRKLSQKKPLVWDTPQRRLEEFQDVFGQNLEALDAEFVKYMAKVH